MKKTSYFIIIFLITVTGIFCYWHLHLEKKKLMNLVIHQQETSEQLFFNLKELSKLQYYGEGKQIKNIPIYTLNGDTVNLRQLLNESKFVVYFSEYGCSFCYSPFLNYLKDYPLLEEKMIILAGFENQRDFKIYIENFEFHCPIYRVNTNLNIYPDYNDYALACIISKDMVINNLLLLDKSNKEYMEDYLRITEQKMQFK